MNTLIWRRSPLPTGSFEEEPSGLEVTWRPKMDICELPGEFLILLGLPGVHPEDVDVTVAGGTMVVSGERKMNIPEGAIIHLIESRGGRFERRIRLPANADVAGTGTEMIHGQLIIRVPKAEPQTVRLSVPRGG